VTYFYRRHCSIHLVLADYGLTRPDFGSKSAVAAGLQKDSDPERLKLARRRRRWKWDKAMVLSLWQHGDASQVLKVRM
jgi:hypothetical protein